MIQLNLYYGPAFSAITKKVKESLHFDKEITIKELLEYYNNRFGQKFNDLVWSKKEPRDFHDQLVIIINGQTYRGENFLNTLLKDGDDLSFLYVYFGG